MVPGSDASGLVAPISLRPVATTALPSQTIATTGALRFRVFRHVCEVFYFRGVRKRRGRDGGGEGGGGRGWLAAAACVNDRGERRTVGIEDDGETTLWFSACSGPSCPFLNAWMHRECPPFHVHIKVEH